MVPTIEGTIERVVEVIQNKENFLEVYVKDIFYGELLITVPSLSKYIWKDFIKLEKHYVRISSVKCYSDRPRRFEPNVFKVTDSPIPNRKL